MKQPPLPTLSDHLLREAQRFRLYPARMYRTETNIEGQELLDDLLRELVEWRATFMPTGKERRLAALGTPVLLDELYCRDLLRSVPEIVQRTLKLSDLTLDSITDPEAFVYLREAARCYILGLDQAAVALARAAIEDPLRRHAGRFLGTTAVLGMDLRDLIDRGRALSREAMALAHQIRVAANEVLHKQPVTADRAFGTVEAARRVVLELSR